ncbi:MAG: electron transfer flavoprotein subunit alpha/FixB family protein [Thermodesulfobacteriota bacterium]
MKEMDQYRGVLVFAERKDSQVIKGSLELLSLGRGLADELQVELSALLVGDRLGSIPEELIYYGADVVYVIENPILERYTTSPYHSIVCDLIRKNKPEIVLFSATHLGMDLAPRVACELKTGLSAHCVDLKMDKENRQLLQICPYFDYMATIVTDTRPQMATVQPGIASLPKRDDSRHGKTVMVEFEIEPGDVKVVEVEVKKEEGTEKIEEADIIIAVGRGLKDMRLAEELASALGGTIGATQPVTDAGLLPESRMIGQTGKMVQPKLYIACGISGAGQHIVGMQNSGTIVAINTDEKAPIFKVADYGIVGDVTKVIPALIDSLKG